MAVDDRLADQARTAAARIASCQEDLDRARQAFQRAVRALYLEGASLREIAEVLDLSHQRVHQLLDLPRNQRTQRGRSVPASAACSFCDRAQAQVGKLIRGPARIGICNDCVGLATRAAVHHAPESDSRTTVTPSHSGRPCSFCGKRAGPDPDAPDFGSTVAAAGDATVVCTACLDLCAEILAEQPA